MNDPRKKRRVRLHGAGTEADPYLALVPTYDADPDDPIDPGAMTIGILYLDDWLDLARYPGPASQYDIAPVP